MLAWLHANVSSRSGVGSMHSTTEDQQLRRRYLGHRFLFPLLDQGPNNQFLQFRVAMAKARQLNRTLVLPIWLPHNPKFQHLHWGAPQIPSRDQRLNQVWYPFETAFEDGMVTRYVRTIPLVSFRALLTRGRLESCITAHTRGFESYLRLSRLSCGVFNTDAGTAWRTRQGHEDAERVRFLGFHLYDYEVGTQAKYFQYVRTARPLVSSAIILAAHLFGGSDYFAAHVRVADAHWEHSDCKHTLGGVSIHSVSCGDGARVINHTSLAREVYFAMRTFDDFTGDSKAVPLLTQVYLASNLNCSDYRVIQMRGMLWQRKVELVCAQKLLLQSAGQDDFLASLIEQEICARARGFVGSKYSTWTDTVRGLRARARRRSTFTFEELWSQGIR